MVTPKPHWNLFLRWLRNAPRASVSGSGSSFFSSVAPTTQLLSTVPGGEQGGDHSFLPRSPVVHYLSTESQSWCDGLEIVAHQNA
ncbi:hypothetical protein EYF80_000485 [Liparis tanakae]|uniref:Uncharacterized protein n=1 Tax=Liparis tanakae TaxID=230148 RepID=A0A4Z2JGW6_9TELE|nr:hypothetical protein EYF80_000485 [Liparis tanakae]